MFYLTIGNTFECFDRNNVFGKNSYEDYESISNDQKKCKEISIFKGDPNAILKYLPLGSIILGIWKALIAGGEKLIGRATKERLIGELNAGGVFGNHNEQKHAGNQLLKITTQ